MGRLDGVGAGDPSKTTVLLVTGLVPRFNNSHPPLDPVRPPEYIASDTIPDAYVSLLVEVNFKPEAPDGLILFNGAHGSQQGGQVPGSGDGVDFVSLGLKNGVPEFRFNVGSATALIRGSKKLVLGVWHSIKIERYVWQSS